ncbi:MAG TPA: hypothetical protein VM510_00970, partial [Caulifigura sp.]|nr:hypothetical protein [Caulifigura sp.]
PGELLRNDVDGQSGFPGSVRRDRTDCRQPRAPARYSSRKHSGHAACNRWTGNRNPVQTSFNNSRLNIGRQGLDIVAEEFTWDGLLAAIAAARG